MVVNEDSMKNEKSFPLKSEVDKILIWIDDKRKKINNNFSGTDRNNILQKSYVDLSNNYPPDQRTPILKDYIDDKLNPNNNRSWYQEIKDFREFLSNLKNLPKMMESTYKVNMKTNNYVLNIWKNSYDESNSSSTLQKNLNSATHILKIDSYDKNIEENFFIMYYLLSYGVIGFFIYKLLKL